MSCFAFAATTAATPIAHSRVSEDLGMALGAYFDDRGGAHFPIFPWAAFVLLGVSCAGMLHNRSGWWRALPFVTCGALTAGIAYAIYRSALAAPPEGWLWRTSPSYLFFLLGLVVVLLGLMHRTGDDATVVEQRSSWGALLARHSLIAYVVHLLLLYGTSYTPSLVAAFGKTLTLAQASVACGFVLTVTLSVARIWDWLENHRLMANGRASLVLFALVLLIR